MSVIPLPPAGKQSLSVGVAVPFTIRIGDYRPDCGGGVYFLFNRLDGCAYIGETTMFLRRWKRHRDELKSGIHHSRRLQDAYDMHGGDAFRFVVAHRNTGYGDDRVLAAAYMHSLRESHPLEWDAVYNAQVPGLNYIRNRSVSLPRELPYGEWL